MTQILRDCESTLPVYSRDEHCGVFRLLQIRRSVTVPGQLMICVQIYQDPSESEPSKAERRQAVEHLILQRLVYRQPAATEGGVDSGVGGTGTNSESDLEDYDGHRVVSFYLQERSETSDAFDGLPPRHVWGEEHITERLMGAEFRLAPLAFFQTNTEGCKVLYDSAFQFLGYDADVMLDLCSGIGTIGQCYCCAAPPSSSKRTEVVGIELNEEAVEMARRNSAINGLSDRASYICARVEDVVEAQLRGLEGSVSLVDLLEETKDDEGRPSGDASADGKERTKSVNDIVTAIKQKEGRRAVVSAVVDPPRPGLHSRVLEALRKCTAIDRLVYVSCNPDSMVADAKRLCTPSEDCRNVFIPVRAVGVDMFPHTYHVETILHMVRYRELTEEHKSAMRSCEAELKEGGVGDHVVPDETIYGFN
eukprot:Selendium_serpulae@DN5761_c0_g1_i1.p1